MARSVFHASRWQRDRSRWLAIVAVCLSIAACSGIEPMAFPDERENPSIPGVFTGEQGEWVIYRKEK